MTKKWFGFKVIIAGWTSHLFLITLLLILLNFVVIIITRWAGHHLVKARHDHAVKDTTENVSKELLGNPYEDAFHTTHAAPAPPLVIVGLTSGPASSVLL